MAPILTAVQRASWAMDCGKIVLEVRFRGNRYWKGICWESGLGTPDNLIEFDRIWVWKFHSRAIEARLQHIDAYYHIMVCRPCER